MEKKRLGVSDSTQRKNPKVAETETTETMSECPKKVSEPDEILCELHIEDGNDSANLEEGEEKEEEDRGDGSSHSQVDVEKDATSETETILDSDDESVNIRKLPRVNCMEKIVLCIDLSKEMEEARFTLSNGQSYSGVQMVKKTLEIFIQTKHTMDSRHLFGLVILTDTVVWITDFTNNAKELCDVLRDLNETSPCNSCDISGLFSSILEKTDLPKVENSEVDSPPFVIRTVVIYGRSQTEPYIDKKNPAFKKLLASNYFFFDFLYIHPLASHDNNVQVIFDNICNLDETHSWYTLEVTHWATKMHNRVASLLGHPLQRPVQRQAHYKIQSIV